MKYTEIAIVGGGPAGLAAALNAAKLGAKVVLIDRNDYLGGQLIKQTHRFSAPNNSEPLKEELI